MKRLKGFVFLIYMLQCKTKNGGFIICGGGQGAGSEISTRTGSGREIQKGKRSLFITANHPVQNTNPATFLDFHLTLSEASNKILHARKRKFVLGLKKKTKVSVKLETFLSHLRS